MKDITDNQNQRSKKGQQIRCGKAGEVEVPKVREMAPKG